MGVSVSFSGGGKRRSFDLTGVPTGEAETFLGNRKKKAIIPDNIRRAMHPQPVDPTAAEKEGKVKLNAFDMRPDTLDKKTMPGSAITTSMTGLCLEGEQNNPVVIGTKFYSSHNGKKGFHSISELDPNGSPARVGVLGEGKEGADTAESQEGAPSAFQVSSRVVMETDDLGRKVLVEYDKDIETTPLGRFAKVTGERRRIVGIVSENKKDKPYPFEVRYDRGWMIWLPSEELLTYDNSAITITDNLSAKGGIHKDGWYKLDDVLPKEGGSLYLNIEKGDSESEGDSETITASFADTSKGKISILISETTLDPVTGRTEVRASVTSAIRLGGGFGGVTNPECRPHPFEVRRFKADFTSDNPDGLFVWIPNEFDLVVINDNVVRLEGLDPAWKSDGRWRSVNGLRIGKDLCLIISKTKDDSESEEEIYHAKLGTTAIGTDGYVQSIRVATIENLAEDDEEPREKINQFVASAVFLYYGGEGGGGSVDVESETVVVISTDYVNVSSDDDFTDHAYAIRVRRGYLRLKGGKLAIEEDDNLKQFIETTPYATQLPSAS